MRFARVVFGVTSSPFLLNATIRHHLNKYLETQPALVENIQESIYVDDVVGGDDDEECAYNFYKGAKWLLRDGLFNLRQVHRPFNAELSKKNCLETQLQAHHPAQYHLTKFMRIPHYPAVFLSSKENRKSLGFTGILTMTALFLTSEPLRA